MEYIIAIGIGGWMALMGIVSSIAVFKSFDNQKRKNRKVKDSNE